MKAMFRCTAVLLLAGTVAVGQNNNDAPAEKAKDSSGATVQQPKNAASPTYLMGADDTLHIDVSHPLREGTTGRARGIRSTLPGCRDWVERSLDWELHLFCRDSLGRTYSRETFHV